MPFTSLSTKSVGDPVTAEDYNLIKTNFDDHESRMSQQEAVNKKIIVFNFPVLNASSASTLTGLTLWRSPLGFTLIDCKLAIFDVGSLTGTLEADIKKSVDLNPANFASVFTTRPSIDFSTAANYDESSNAVFDVLASDLIEGDYLRFDVTSMPTSGVLGKFIIYLIGEV